MSRQNRALADRAAYAALLALNAVPTLLCAALVLAPVFAFAQDAPPCEEGASLYEGLAPEIHAEIEREAAAVPNGEGRLFRIAGRDGVADSFLFGTMHLSDPAVLALPAPAEAAFETAGQLVIETTEIADEAGVAAAVLSRPDLTLLPAGTRLTDLVEAPERASLEEALAAAGTPADAVGTLQPWFLTAGLVVPPCELARQAAGETVLDLALLRRAEEDGKSVHGLETAVEQLEAIASMPLDLQAENLVATLAIRDRLPDIFATMIDLYGEGRIGAITPTVEHLAPSGSSDAASLAVAAGFEDRVVTRRNHVMAERMAPMLDAGGAFVAVGALHLPGAEGLVELLRADGREVVRAD